MGVKSRLKRVARGIGRSAGSVAAPIAGLTGVATGLAPAIALAGVATSLAGGGGSRSRRKQSKAAADAGAGLGVSGFSPLDFARSQLGLVPSPAFEKKAPSGVPFLNGGGGGGVAQIGGATNKFGQPVTVTGGAETRMRCPRGYVSVVVPQGDGSMGRACMLRAPAISMGLWSPRKKGPISPKEWAAVKAIGRVQKKLRTLGTEAKIKPRTVRARAAK